jgi:hypothetical protein
MQARENNASEHEEIMSPVEERHIDYILEEEFSIDPDFLTFFLGQARLSAIDKNRIVAFGAKCSCRASRSTTTEDGESDLLVKYSEREGVLPIAILIEDKIRAGFQPTQAERYRKRGEEGKGERWADYWTCLVAHSKYSAKPGDFDAVVTLDALHRYFADKDDDRSRFRARILEQTIRKYETTGIQTIDPNMTRFRAMYAAACDASLPSGRWWYEPPRDAWWDANWFLFRGIGWPKGVKVVHMARSGRMQLVLPMRDEALLRSVVEQRAAWHPNGSAPSINVVPVGKAKSAFQINVPKITDFSIEAPPPEFEQFFAAVEFFASFYERSSDLLPQSLHIPNAQEDVLREDDAYMRALSAMLLGFMRSTVTRLGTAMPFPLPDLRRLTAATPEDKRYFASLGLMGGFLLELREDKEQEPYILSEYWSRQWGTESVRNKITASEVLHVGDQAVEVSHSSNAGGL